MHAQSPKTLEFGPHAGMTTSINDINTWKLFNQFDLEYGGLIRYNYDSRWAFRLDFTHAVVKGTDTIAQWRPERELSFRSKINDVSLMVEFNFLDYYTGRVGSTISPYLFGGVSVFSFHTFPYTRNDMIDEFWLGDLLAERVGFRHYALSIPFGFGCKFSLSPHLATSLEWRMHYTFTDHLDDIAGVYPVDGDHALLVSSEKGLDLIYGDATNLPENMLLVYDFTDPSGNYHEGQQRGNSQSKDWFGSLSLSITWKIPLPGGTACRVINY